MAETRELLKMEHIKKEYYGNVVLHDVSLTIKAGEIVGLVGENGAGKTTLMKLLFGMPVIRETGGFEGKITLEGKPCNFKNPFDALAAGIGMVHQEFSLIPGFSAAENIVLNRESVKNNLFVEVFGERMKTLDRPLMQKRALAAIAKLGVNLSPDMLVTEMPVGHKQFTEIAREIAREGIKLLVLDEPSAVLTETEATILLSSLRVLAKSGIAIIFISHRLQEVLDVCDRVVVLRDGTLVQDTSTKGVTIPEIATWMVGRDLDTKEAVKADTRVKGEDELVVQNLWVDMPGEIVRNVSFTVKKGEIFGLGGLAGQGKLGIPNGLMGLFSAGGSVSYKNKPLPLNNARKVLELGMAFVSEDRRGVGLLLDEPIDWNIAFTAMQIQSKFLKKYGFFSLRNDAEIVASAKDYIKMLDIKCTGTHQAVRELSGGNQQKICLAKAFAVQPGLLFVSEPTRGIDIGAKKLVLDTLKRYNRDYGTTIVIVSSELEELRSVADRIAIVDEGCIAGILSPHASLTEFGLLMAGRIKKEEVVV